MSALAKMDISEQKERLTAEDLLRLPEDGRRYELVRGELIEMTSPGGQHGRIASRLDRRLGQFVETNALGEVMVEAGFCLECSPDTVRGPDVSFLAADRVPPEGLPAGFIAGAPDLAVEIVSPNDTAAKVQAKAQDYLTHGTWLVWVVEPETRTVLVYRPDGSAQLLGADDSLEGEDVVPGFVLPVRELFT